MMVIVGENRSDMTSSDGPSDQDFLNQLTDDEEKSECNEKDLEEEFNFIRYSQLWPSVLAVIVACLPSLNAGFAIGFSSPAARDFEAGSDNLILTNDQITWHGSLLNLLAVAGSFVCGPIMDVIGRRLTINISTLLFFTSWIIISTSSSVSILLVGRCICGLAYGSGLAVASVYLGEVGPVFIRGMLGTLINLLMSLGILIGLAFGTILKWRDLAQVGCCVAFISFISCGMLPESPFWLFRRYIRDRSKEKSIYNIVKTLKTLRVENPKIIACKILKEIRKNREEKFEVKQLWASVFYKPLLIVIMLNVSQQLSGINVVFYYMHNLFKITNQGIAPISVGIVNLVAMTCAMGLMDRLGRRKLMLISSIGAAFSLAALGFSMFLNIANVDNSNSKDYSSNINFTLNFTSTYDDSDFKDVCDTISPVLDWISLISALSYIIFYGFGLGPVAFIAIGELIPLQGRGFAGGVATATNGLSAFFVIKLFPKLATIIPVYIMFICFGIYCFGVAAFVYRLMPETKGKSLEEIQKSFISVEIRNTA